MIYKYHLFITAMLILQLAIDNIKLNLIKELIMNLHMCQTCIWIELLMSYQTRNWDNFQFYTKSQKQKYDCDQFSFAFSS